ncbi:unnamed protein product [Closterium sp. Naga37s-1]|nr:unnamed protein product [Closterium sp. Naga37s-1]
MAFGLVEFESAWNAATDDRPLCFERLLLPGVLKGQVYPSQPTQGTYLDRHLRIKLGLEPPGKVEWGRDGMRGWRPRVLYITRLGAELKLRRTFLPESHEALLRLMEELGLQVTMVEMGQMTFRQQFEAIQSADIVISLHGAALTNVALFARRTTALIEIMPYGAVHELYYSLSLNSGIPYFLKMCRKAGFSLYKNVDLPKQALDSNEDDPELILFILFTTDVKIKSIAIIGGADGTSPAKMRVFTNREDIDFSVVNDLTAVQEWDLTENLQGELEYTTKFSKFQGVSSLTLHLPSNFGGDFSRIHFVGLKGEATQNNRRAVAAVVYEAQANPSDHEVPADMGVPKSFDASSIGVCWGRVAWQPLPPRIVVKLLQDNKISKVKLFNADPQVMKALVGSKLEVTVMVANELLNDMAMSPKKAQDWVDYNVKRYAFPGGADISAFKDWLSRSANYHWRDWVAF